MFKSDGNVIHFAAPKGKMPHPIQDQLGENAVSGEDGLG